MKHDKISHVVFTKNAPMYHVITIDGDEFVVPRYMYWSRQRRYFTIDHNYYGDSVKKRTYTTGGLSSTLQDVIQTYTEMCSDLENNADFVNTCHLSIGRHATGQISLSHSILLQHDIMPIDRITISRNNKVQNTYDVRYRAPRTRCAGYTKRCDASREGIISAIQYILQRAAAGGDLDLSRITSIQEFMNRYPSDQPMRYCGYETYKINRVSTIAVSRMRDQKKYHLTYILNDIRYVVECDDDRQSIIDEINDIIGIYQIQAPNVYRKSRSMINFHRKYGS